MVGRASGAHTVHRISFSQFSCFVQRVCMTRVCRVHLPRPHTNRRFIIARVFSHIHHINIVGAAAVATAIVVVVRPTTSFYSRCSATVFLSLPLLWPRVCTIPTLYKCPTTKTNIYIRFFSLASLRVRCEIFSGLRKSPYAFARRFHFSFRVWVCFFFAHFIRRWLAAHISHATVHFLNGKWHQQQQHSHAECALCTPPVSHL